MIILTDCLSDKTDEGCLKVVNSLAKRIKNKNPETLLVSYERKSKITDAYLKLNKLFLNYPLFKLINKKNVLYIPFASNTLASIIRCHVLSMFSRKNISVLFALRHPMNGVTKFLLKHSTFNIITLSKESYDYYMRFAERRVCYLKTGVDTHKFSPVDINTKRNLRLKYQFDLEKPIILHVGHLHSGRNVEALLNINADKQVILVISSIAEPDLELRKKIESKGNIRIIDEYISDIEEIYQMSDVYLFPVINQGNCIDVPLSVLEAVSCGLKVIATEYGELKEFQSCEGFQFITNFSENILNQTINKILMTNSFDSRSMIKCYDWEESIKKIYTINSDEY